MAILNPQQWDDRNDRYFMELYQEYRGAKGLYGLCAAMCAETYHHWRVFTGGSGGACIVLKRAPLAEYLDAASKKPAVPVTNVRFGEVEYLKLPKVRKIGRTDIMRLPFLKRVGFADEKEFRIVIETSADQQGAIYIDCPSEWIDRIYINPWLPQQQAASLIATLNEIDGCVDVDVRRSILIDSSTWKMAGDRAAGKKTGRKLTLKAPVKKALKGPPVKRF
ncbi:DUF2971 domain-containing protein [Mesorhizobium muleiense]|uniref:DUF2971 domain-containing protein n=2 Tax=Mesorhizobium muleiense TaxID=1004279 RepID=A0A1G8V4H2_9HYPH|nr:DUF2971 domain-containing protein [Mesorhizobium muleiense]SDJ60941.1 hypothetical protein SAMN05428953_107202 [Mesorhizobium muleiense]